MSKNRLISNRDGYVSREEWQSYRQQMEALRNAGGKPAPRLPAGVIVGEPPNESGEATYRQADMNRDGDVSNEEWEGHRRRLEQHYPIMPTSCAEAAWRLPPSCMELFGIRLLGLNEATGHKLFLTVALIGVLVIVGLLLRTVVRTVTARSARRERLRFWARQGRNLLIALLALIGLVSIWFDDPANLSMAMGLVTAGLAFALQKVVTSIAGYFVILRGKNFTVGDRITMGGVRGDVVGLGFFQTTIMEMGQPPAVQGAEPPMWVRSRQFTGRIVTVANSKIFDEPIYNYTRDFPFIWEEMRIPVSYRDDRQRVERILLDAARRYAVRAEDISLQERERLAAQYRVDEADFEPKVYWRLTDNWLELAVRLLTPAHHTRDVKDGMTREVLGELDRAGIGIASATYEIVGLPPLRVRKEDDPTHLQ